MRNSPDIFVAIAIELIQSVGSVTGAITPFAVRLPSSIFRRGFRAKGTFLGGEITGCTVGSLSMYFTWEPAHIIIEEIFLFINQVNFAFECSDLANIFFVHCDEVCRCRRCHHVLCCGGGATNEAEYLIIYSKNTS